MKKLFTIFAILAMLCAVGCEEQGGDGIFNSTYDINGAIQKGPFVQGSIITIQPLNKHLKPIGQVYSTQTINDAGLFEMEGVNSKFAEIIAMGYYFDEVEGKVSAAPLTLRSIVDLKEGSQTNVNLLTTLTYDRIKHLVTNEGKSISDAGQQAERELYTVLDIPADMQPSVNCSAMNIANNGEGDGLLLAISAVMQEGRSVGELSEYIAKLSADLADDGKIEQTLLEKFNLDGSHKLGFKSRIKDNLIERYNSLGVEYTIPNYEQYLSFWESESDDPSKNCVISFTYTNKEDAEQWMDDTWDRTYLLKNFGFLSNNGDYVDVVGYAYYDGVGELYLSQTPTTIEMFDANFRRRYLESIIIPKSVHTVGLFAFSSSAIKRVQFEGDSINLEGGAFSDCQQLAYVSLENIVDENKLNLENNRGSGVVFSGCENLAEFRGTVASKDGRCLIKNGLLLAFAPQGLSEYTIPDGVTSIDSYVFAECKNLKSVVVPDGVTSIGYRAFAYCEKLKNITLPNSITHLGDYVFEDCKSLESIVLPDGITIINNGIFSGCSSLKHISIPNGVTEIGICAFANCLSLENVTIPNSVTNIDDWAFSYCDGLKSIELPDGITAINCGTFYGCTSLQNTNIPDSVTYIADAAFYYCDFKQIIIPNDVTIIEDMAFYGCGNLTEIYCKPTAPPVIRYYWYDGFGSSYVADDGYVGSFPFNDNMKIYVPRESYDDYMQYTSAPADERVGSQENWYAYESYIEPYDFE